MRMLTTSALALAVTLGLGSTAIANEGAQKNKEQRTSASMHQDHRNRQGTTLEARIGRSEADRLAREFRQLDQDSDGVVMVSELDSGTRAELQHFDADDDDRLDRYEFEMAYSARFQDLDTDNDGALTKAEIELVKPEWVSFVALDADNDRALSRQEYRTFIDSGDWVRDRDRYAFGYIDRDSSGDIDNDEAAVYVPLASSFTAHDPDGDGVIERTEYEVFLAEVDLEQQRSNRVARTDSEAMDGQD